MKPKLYVISLRYSSWSIRALLPLWHAGADVDVETVQPKLTHQGKPEDITDHDAHVREATEELARRRSAGSVTGNYPVLWVGGQAGATRGTPIHETLAICEWTAEQYPEAGLWPQDRLQRAQARALSAEMASGFWNLRAKLSSHPLARVPGLELDGPTRVEVARVFELWTDALNASGGPFLFGPRFGIVDAFYFPVLMRFETYGVPVPEALRPYADALHGLPAIQRWRALAAGEPHIPVYDAYIESLGGEVVPR